MLEINVRAKKRQEERGQTDVFRPTDDHLEVLHQMYQRYFEEYAAQKRRSAFYNMSVVITDDMVK
jgi:hypothetical protein